MIPMPEYIVGFTGPRPQNLPKHKGVYEGIREFLLKFCQHILKQNSHRDVWFISGGAIGFDLEAASVVLSLQKQYPNAKLLMALPCTNQDEKWLDADKRRYKEILAAADSLHYTSDRAYWNGCMSRRNLYIVERSNIILSCWDGVSRGTGETLTMAYKNGIPAIVYHPTTTEIKRIG